MSGEAPKLSDWIIPVGNAFLRTFLRFRAAFFRLIFHEMSIFRLFFTFCETAAGRIPDFELKKAVGMRLALNRATTSEQIGGSS